MKKLLVFLYSFIFTVGSVNAEYVTIPDENFRNFLIEKYPGCFNEAGEMDASCIEITREDSLSLSSFEYSFLITDLKGIKYFTSLKYLECSFTAINHLPELPTSLTALVCSNCYELTSLSLPPNLTYLDCSSCQFNSIPPLPDSIKYLDFSYNNLTGVSFLPKAIETFNCSENLQIESLPELPATLTNLNCSGNHITALPAMVNSNILVLVCGDNPLGSLPALPKTLQTLYCYSNDLSDLPILPDGCIELNCSLNPGLGTFISGMTFSDTLLYLSCQECYIFGLPPLPPRLRFLDCGFNQLISLPVLPESMSELICLYNQLNKLPDLPIFLTRLTCYHNDIYCLPKMPGYVDTTGIYRFQLDFDGDKIKCIPNLPPNAVLRDFSEGTGVEVRLPVCDPTNNSNRCTPFPSITGIVFFDNNNNDILDINEPVGKNIKAILSNGTIAYTNENGYFEISADSTGDYTLSIAAPALFINNPASYSYHFTSYDTLVLNQFALHSAISTDSLSININPVNTSATPGLPIAYLVDYQNTGTTALSPEIIFNYDSTRLSYDSSSAAVVNNNGNHLTIPMEDILPGEHGKFIVYFLVKPTSVTGDSIHADVLIIANGHNYSDSNNIAVNGSMAGNVKQATEQLSPEQVTSGGFIEYSIYFQNTGTGPAYNVVISDTISSMDSLNTLVVTSSSHSCKTSVKGNIIYFELLDISLADSATDKIKSQGFVTFKIKPAASVTTNSIIENKASIYFDYNNMPITTNTTISVIKNPGKIFIFTGDGNWDNNSNWKNSIIPPSSLTQNEMVIIDPVAGGSCILNVPVSALTGASVIVKTDKQFVIPNSLIIQ